MALRRSRKEVAYRESLHHILLEAERTTRLIEQLLSLARADSGREALRMQAVDLSLTLRDVAESWQQVAGLRNLQFSASIEGSESVVLGDETVLRRLADILLDNAFKYTPSPGRVHLSLEHMGDSAVLAVEDSGVGIAPEDQNKIFERFYRVDKARSRAQGGAGLGLSIAQWIVLQHHGSISVESRPGSGAIFRVELPMIATPVHNSLTA
jgi:signal transduction histidine kinase